MVIGTDGLGVAESTFRGTRLEDDKTVGGLGIEALEIAEGKIKELRDYHRSAAEAQPAQQR
jgi:hypothetical protein